MSDNNTEVAGMVRYASKQYLGGNCTFVDDDLRTFVVLAKEAIKEGLHKRVVEDETLLGNIEKAFEEWGNKC